MTIIGYNNHSERVASLIIEARKSLADTAAQNPPVNSTSPEAKATLDSILSDANAVASGLEPYTELCTNVPDPNSLATKVVKEILEATESTDWAGLHASGQTTFKLMPAMSSNLYEAGLVSFLCSLLRPKRVLEIGMFTGTGTTMFAASKSVQRVVTLENEAFLEAWCQLFWKKAGEGVYEKIDVRIGPAKDSLEKIADDHEEPFDMIFLDADKSSYPTYFRQILKHKLLAPKGILMIDNSIFKATAYAPFPVPTLSPSGVDQGLVNHFNECGKVLYDFNLEIVKHPEVEVVMLPIRDGLSLVRWKSS